MSLVTTPARRLVTLVGGTAVAAALATGLASCGSAGSPSSSPGTSGGTSSATLTGLAPDQAVKTAFENLGHATTVHTQLKLDTSSGAAADMTRGPGAMTGSQASLLQHGTVDVTLTAPQGETIDQMASDGSAQDKSNPAAADVSLNNGGSGPLASIRTVGGSLYAMADLQQLSQVAGTDLSKDATALGAQSPALRPITSAVVAGKWLELSSGALGSFGNLLGQGSGSPSAGPGAGIATDLRSALSHDVTWTAGSTAGTYDGTLQAKSFVSDLYPDLAQVSQLSGDPLPSEEAVLAKIPDGTTVSAEVATAGDQVSSVTLDLLQFDHDQSDLKELGPDPKVDLVAAFDTTTAAVTAPSGAVLLDKQLPSLLMNLGGMSGGSRI